MERLTERIIGAAFEVSNQLGHGFLEAVYQKALVHELGLRDLSVEEQVSFQVLNYLKASGLNVALLINFGKPKVEFRRVLL